MRCRSYEVWGICKMYKNKAKTIRLKKIARLVKGSKILDIGFVNTPNIYLKGDIVGLDIKKVPIPENYSSIIVHDLNKKVMPFPDESFDTIIAGEIIEHLQSPYNFLKEIRRILKPQGKLLLTTPQAHFFGVILHNLLMKWIPDPNKGGHLYEFSMMSMVRLLKAIGFRTKKRHGCVLTIPKTKLVFSCSIPILTYQVLYECEKA